MHFTTPSVDSFQAENRKDADDLYLQCLRVLRCSARAMAGSPGGLRFKAGTRPWLEGLESGLGPLATPGNAFLQPLMQHAGVIPRTRRTY